MPRVATYKVDSDDVPVLRIAFKVGVPHQLVVLQDSHPILADFHLFLHIAVRAYELLDVYGGRIIVLKD